MKKYFRIPMQFFAEDPAPPGQNPPTEPNPPEPAPGDKGAEPKPNPKPEPSKPKLDIPSDEELAEFRKWQDSQKSDAEKHAAALGKAEKAKLAAEERAAAAELKVTAMSKGVSAEALDDVIALAKTKISDNTTAEQAIEDILKKYPAFTGAASKPVTTGTATPNNSPNMETDEAKIRRVMGLPEKK